jgi:sugar lactone lactonase YvrE
MTAGESYLIRPSGLESPMGIAFDAGGNLFIADSMGCQVFEVASATGNIEFGTTTTPMTINHPYRVATTTYNIYGGPSDVAFDASGNMYIADEYNDFIWEVNPTNGSKSAFADTSGSSGYTGDGGQIAGAMLNKPCGLAFDSSGNLYIADSGNNAIREVGASYQAPGLPLSVVPASFMFVQQNEIGTPIRVSITYKQFILVASRHSSQVIGGRMEGSRRASIVSPVLVTNVIIKVIMCK